MTARFEPLATLPLPDTRGRALLREGAPAGLPGRRVWDMHPLLLDAVLVLLLEGPEVEDLSRSSPWATGPDDVFVEIREVVRCDTPLARVFEATLDEVCASERAEARDLGAREVERRLLDPETRPAPRQVAGWLWALGRDPDHPTSDRLLHGLWMRGLRELAAR